METLKARIRTVPDFPKPGILFYDITTLLQDSEGFRLMLDALAQPFRGQRIDLVVGIESRGFILAAPLADRLGTGFVPIRKPKKLPAATISESFKLEYGTDAIEIHADAIRPGQRVLLVDDVLATGGTARAAAALVRRLGGELTGMAFLIELAGLNGRAQLTDTPLHVVLTC
jgi:adenine phosphoribosyltransferase